MGAKSVTWLGHPAALSCVVWLAACSLFPDTPPLVDANGSGGSGGTGAGGVAGTSPGGTGGTAGVAGSAGTGALGGTAGTAGTGATGATGGTAGGDGGCGAPKTTTLEAVADTYIVNVPPLSTHGSESVLEILAYNEFAGRRVLLRFDVASSVPLGSVIDSAKLLLKLGVNEGGTHEAGVHRVSQPWVEASCSWTKYDATGSWTKQGGDYALAPSASRTVDPSSAVGSVLDWDVKADVQGFVDGSLTNLGWLLKQDNDAVMNGETLQFPSREAASPGDRPQLEVVYRECP